jgi:hypothetical protein
MTDQPQNEIIRLSNQFREALLKKDRAAINRLIAAYKSLYGRLKDKIDLLVSEIGTEAPTVGQLVRMTRYKSLLKQVAIELNDFQVITRSELEAIGRVGIETGLSDSRRMIRLYTDAFGIDADFNALPKDAIETLLGFLQEDGPLYKRLQELAPKTAQGISDVLVEGIGLGYGPGKTARAITNQLGMALTDSLRMVRTVQLWSYREASRASYIANAQIVDGWIWHAQLDGLTCMSCVAMHGTEHRLDEALNDHHNGRCAMIPVVPGLDRELVVPQTGEQWFENLSEAEQRKMMGKHFHEAYQSGAFNIGDMTMESDNDVFGNMRVQTPLWQLLGAESPVRMFEQLSVK